MDNNFKKKLNSLKKRDLIDALVELYHYGDDQVRMIVENLCVKNNTQDLAENLRQEINRWIQRKNFITYSGSFNFARNIEIVFNQIENELLKLNPEAAFKLIDKIVRSDGKIIEGVDDSSGSVGDLLNEFSILWLKAAAKISKPKTGWVENVIEIAEGDHYGCRNQFLENVALLLTEEEMRRLIIYFRQKALSMKDEKSRDKLDYECFTARINMQQVAVALKDPEIYEEAMRISKSTLNNLQMLDIISCYLRFDWIDRAIDLLKSTKWEKQSKIEALDLEKEAMEKRGNHKELKSVLKKLFEASPSTSRLKEYTNVLHKKEQKTIIEKALKKATTDDDLYRGLEMLITFRKHTEAEHMVIQRAQELERYGYTTLLELVESFKQSGSLLAQVILYRTLILDILNLGRTKAYRHAARYLSVIEKLEKKIDIYPSEMDSQESFYSLLKENHGKKRSFWARVNSVKSRENG